MTTNQEGESMGYREDGAHPVAQSETLAEKARYEKCKAALKHVLDLRGYNPNCCRCSAIAGFCFDFLAELENEEAEQ